MLFNSYEFIVFFVAVTSIFFLLPHKFRWFHLLVASCLFYMAFVPVYIFILFFTIIIDYVAGLLIFSAAPPKKRLYLIMSIVANVGVLCYFKYFNFFAVNFNIILDHTHIGSSIPLLGILLPIGLSFHTFQAMSYTIEVYRGNQTPERHLGVYALYVMFYPQLVAGPIERPQNILPQFHMKQNFSYENASDGFKLILWGLFKKVAVADRLAVITDSVYSNLLHYSHFSILLTVILFAFQLFCDFSGYSDIAVGTAQVMGFKLMVNFNRPFASKSVTEFWRRWHISLATWFNDYVFNPMVFSLRNLGKLSIVIGLLVTFFLSGFWHGAGWNFIIYGLLNGLALVYEFFTKKKRKKLMGMLPVAVNNFISKCLTVGFIAFSWIFFRSPDFHTARYVIRQLPKAFFDIVNQPLNTLVTGNIVQSAPISLFLIFFMEFVHFVTRDNDVVSYIREKPRVFRWSIYYIVFLLTIFLGVFEQRSFIYFQF